jgi:hypothetical protein
LFLFFTYDIGFQDLTLSWRDTVKVTSQISEVGQEFLVGGGRADVVKSLVKVNEQTLTVVGYGPRAEEARVGESVEILVPKHAPGKAWLEGYWAHPVASSLVLRLALWFSAIPLLLLVTGFIRGRQKLVLLVEGEPYRGEAKRQVSLPRPLKDYRVSRVTYRTDAGKEHRFWTLLNESEEEPLVLVKGRKAGVLSRLLSHHRIHGEVLTDDSLVRKILFKSVVALVVLQLVSALLFLLT